MPQMQTSRYRQDIEGLRAIAIFAVVGCHANLPLFIGGFVGVDVFFVLSGYLITGLLVKEISDTGRINFLAFYCRRLKRLLPGLSLMLLASSIAASAILAPHEQPAEALTAAFSVLWVSNIYFALQRLDYFDSPDINLFLHTWSLSVEEQFYLVWPLLILLFARTKTHLIYWLVLVFFVSLILCVFISAANPQAAFYLMPTRSWQFALGGIAWSLSPFDGKRFVLLRQMVGYAGLILILVSVLYIHEGITYPGIAALIPSLGAALVIFSGQSKLLSAKPLQAIGRVSYSWYLWHWPVLILGGVVFARSDFGFQVFLVVISLLVAVAAYYFFENPIRNNAALISSPSKAVFVCGLMMASGAMLANSWKTYSANNESSLEFAKYAAIRSDIPSPYAMGCDEGQRIATIKPCIFGDESAPATAVLFADSVGTQWFSAFEEKYTRPGWRLIVLVKTGCAIVDQSSYPPIKGMYEKCALWKEAASKYLEELKPDVVFIGSSIQYKLSASQWAEGARGILRHLSGAAKQVFVIRSTPRLGFDGPNCLARHEWRTDPSIGIADCSIKRPASPDDEVYLALQKTTGELPNTGLLDLNSLVCPDDICAAHNGRVVVYRDGTHITNTFVKSISKQVGEIIDQAQ